MADGAGGVLVHTVGECAKAVVALLRDPEHARDLARKGRERVREHFLLPRLLLNELELMQDLAAGRPIVPVEDPLAIVRATETTCGQNTALTWVGCGFGGL